MLKYNVHIIARENLFHPCKTVWCPADLLQRRPGTVRCYHIQTPAGVRTTYDQIDHAREKSLKSPGARTIADFAGVLQIAKIVQRQFYL